MSRHTRQYLGTACAGATLGGRHPECLAFEPVGVLSLLAAQGDGAIAVVIVASIVVPLVALGGLCWFFWNHRHDE